MTLEDFSKAITKLRAGFLFDEHEITENMPLMAEQYFLLALGSLDAAERFMKLAHMHLVQSK
jgi:hypothetical protein